MNRRRHNSSDSLESAGARSGGGVLIHHLVSVVRELKCAWRYYGVVSENSIFKYYQALKMLELILKCITYFEYFVLHIICFLCTTLLRLVHSMH